MASKKAGGSSKNGRDSGPQYLGTKLYAGETAQIGSVLVRQRGTVILPGSNVRVGKDHTLYAVKDGAVSFADVRKKHFDGSTHVKKIIHVL